MRGGECDGWHLLGPVRLTRAAGEIALGPVKQRCLAAALLMSPGRPVPVDLLVERIWGDRPPRSDKALAPYASRLRRILSDVGPGFDPGAIRFTDGGYRLDCDPDQVDLHRARRVARAARAAGAQGDPGRASELLRQALDGWQPVALAGLTGNWAKHTGDALARERRDLLAEKAQFDLQLGRHAAVIEDLRALVAENPSAEPLVAAMLMALAGAGRSSEALSLYDRHRQVVAEELGATPAPALAALHLRILRNDPALISRPSDSREVKREVLPARPFQLPADVPGFTGRLSELDRLDAHLEVGAAAPMVISAVSGTAGVGKTALAVRWAHRVRDRFPDGQLYANLRGYDSNQPMRVTDVLARFLVALGVPESDVPVDLETRAARFRTETSNRRMLILLDNAGSVDQVRPLLPGSNTCLVLVTSRDSLAGLVAVDGAQRIQLDLLPEAEAIALLRRLIGDRVDAEPVAATALAEQCVRLPLALRVAAERAVAQEHSSLTDLVNDLADQQHRLERLDAGEDSRAAVSVVFSWSLRSLPAWVVRIFALLGLHPGPSFEVHGVAALAAVPLEQARRALDRLTRAHLVQSMGAGRFGMHDLLRAYAVSLVPTVDDPQQVDGVPARIALDRLFDFYLAATERASYRLDPFEIPQPQNRPVAAPLPELDDPRSARDWLAAERSCLQVMATYTAVNGWPEHCIRLAGALFSILASAGANADALVVLGAAGEATVRTGDKAGQAQVLSNLGAVHRGAGRYAEARTSLDQAVTLFAACGEVTRQARALARLGGAEAELGHHTVAGEHLRKALSLLDERAEPDGLQEVAAKVVAHVNLGPIEARLGRPDSAIRHLLAARELCDQINDEVGVAWATMGLGDVEARSGRLDRAAEYHRQAIVSFQAFEERGGETTALNGLGEVCAPSEAIRHHRAALALAVPAQARGEQARAHLGLARAYRALGETGRARQHYQQAIANYAAAGMPLADTARTELADLTAAD